VGNQLVPDPINYLQDIYPVGDIKILDKDMLVMYKDIMAFTFQKRAPLVIWGLLMLVVKSRLNM